MIVRVGNDAVDALRATSVNDMLSSAQWGRPKWGGRSFFEPFSPESQRVTREGH